MRQCGTKLEIYINKKCTEGSERPPTTTCVSNSLPVASAAQGRQLQGENRQVAYILSSCIKLVN